MRARAASSKSSNVLTKPTNTTPSADDLSTLRLKKQDKRHLKHAALMHKVRDASISKSAGKKRRRPGKKIAAADSLGGLRDALPEIEEDEDEEAWEGLSDGDAEMNGGMEKKTMRRRADGEGKIKMRSLKHRPRSMKRKQALERKEQERFAKNLAQLAGNERSTGESRGPDKAGGEEARGDGGGQAEKWAALRAFIGGTMERDKAFGKG